MFNLFFNSPQKWLDGDIQFIIFPHSNIAPNGWGAPVSNNIPTIDGENPNSLLSLNTYTYSWANTWAIPHKQIAGNIDWKGGVNFGDVPEDIDNNLDYYNNNYTILTWNGPINRYWNPKGFGYEFGGNDLLTYYYGAFHTKQAFATNVLIDIFGTNNADGYYDYDIETKSNEIYKDGGYLTAAPYPVLGAAIVNESINENLDYEDGLKKYILAICKNGENDVAFYTELISPTNVEDIIDLNSWKSDRISEWLEIALFPKQTVNNDVALVEPTPWHFNRFGNQARTMRLTERTYVDEGGTEKTDKIWSEYVFNVSFIKNDNNILEVEGFFNNLGVSVDDGIVFSDSCIKTVDNWVVPSHPDYPPDAPVGETLREDYIKQDIIIKGKLKVAVDWSNEENTWIYAWINYDCATLIEQFTSYGIIDIEGIPTEWFDGYRYPPSPVVSKGDHTPSTWLGLHNKTTLDVGNTSDNINFKFYLGFTTTGNNALFNGIIDFFDEFGNPIEVFDDNGNLVDNYDENGDYIDLYDENGNLLDFVPSTSFHFIDSFDFFIHYIDIRNKFFSGYIAEETTLMSNVTFEVEQPVPPNQFLEYDIITYTKQTHEWAGVGHENNWVGGEFFMTKTYDQLAWTSTFLPALSSNPILDGRSSLFGYSQSEIMDITYDDQSFIRTNYSGLPSTDNIFMFPDPDNAFPGQNEIYLPDYRTFFFNNAFKRHREYKDSLDLENLFIPLNPPPTPDININELTDFEKRNLYEPDLFERRSVSEYLLSFPDRKRHYRQGIFASHDSKASILNYIYFDETANINNNESTRGVAVKMWPEINDIFLLIGTNEFFYGGVV